MASLGRLGITYNAAYTTNVKPQFRFPDLLVRNVPTIVFFALFLLCALIITAGVLLLAANSTSGN